MFQPMSRRPTPSIETAQPRAGIGLRGPHMAEIAETGPRVGFLEVHTENFMGAGGPPRRMLDTLRRDYPVSMHGVGLSLGSADGLDPEHLERTRATIAAYDPALVSEHLAWCSSQGAYLNDLLPVPYTEETLALLADHVHQVQDAYRQPILVENPSLYMQFADEAMSEPAFMKDLARRTGCGILLDVNNVYVSAMNLGRDPARYLDELAGAPVGEIHLAGHHVRRLDDGHILRIDDHGSPVPAAVWQLYGQALDLFGAVPTLIEWDSQLPPLADLLAEAEHASALVQEAAAHHA